MKKSFLFFAAILVSVSSCGRPEPGPDKTVAGAVLGGAWGAGAGAVVGHQVGAAGEGAAIGAGFGAVAGIMQGAQHDALEDYQIAQNQKLNALEVQNAATGAEIAQMQGSLDRARMNGAGPQGVFQVFFDSDETSMRLGATSALEVFARNLQQSPTNSRVYVIGHTDDTGSPAYNERLAEARARSVSSFIAAQGVSTSRIVVKSYGAKRAVASNMTEAGRQLNRRVEVYVAP
jgi:outer membrane protein OmpA-like peptidoglycan-associated protein